MERRWRVSKIFAYDLETTGTNPGKHGIHQIAGIILIEGKEKERFEIKVRPNPKADIDPEALKVAGVTLEQIMAYPPMEEGYRQLVAILGKHVSKFNKQDKFALLGYNNAGFDDNFLRGLFLQNGDQYFGSFFWADPLDVRVLAMRQLLPIRHTMENFKLMTVARQMGIEIDESKLHDAVYDVEVTLEIFKRLRLTKTELEGLHGDFIMQEAIELAYEQLDNFESLLPNEKAEEGMENIKIALNILRKFIKPAVAACLLFFFVFSFNISESQAQFKKDVPKSGSYAKWSSKREFNGYKFNRGQRNAFGLKHGLLGTGLFANSKKNKSRKNQIQKPQSPKKTRNGYHVGRRKSECKPK